MYNSPPRNDGIDFKSAAPKADRLKVAFFNHIGDAMGGAEQTLLTTLRHRPEEMEAYAILFEDGRFAEELRDINVAVHIEPAPESVTKLHREKLNFAALMPIPGLVIRIASFLRRHQVDVLYTNSMKAHLIGALAGRVAGVRCVMHFHDHIEGMGLAMLRTAAILGSDERIACSKDVRAHIGVDKTSVVYSPVEVAAFGGVPGRAAARAALKIGIDLPTISLIGRINRWKGHDRFIRIAKLVNLEMPVQFLIVGSPIFRDEDFLPELVSLVQKEKLVGVVSFIPWLENLSNVYGATDVLVNCSTREPLGRTPAEAASVGIPSVVFDDSGAAEWLTANSYSRVVPAGNEQAMAAAILDIIKTSDPKCSAAMRELAQIFEPVGVAQNIANIVGACAKPKRRMRCS